ncbi:hypothetical protein IWQ60_003626 [Tieghemiomyces parasiticus]|uniref:Uncharacterized protein n=1 Tax=Tieghemiomyces parasiticus TaxID=78921 RepID=A0A9W8AA00_9FUNG|nr:hypothetical protein IWQ60_003626 [Tieghemiomyces parasiticus]
MVANPRWRPSNVAIPARRLYTRPPDQASECLPISEAVADDLPLTPDSRISQDLLRRFRSALLEEDVDGMLGAYDKLRQLPSPPAPLEASISENRRALAHLDAFDWVCLLDLLSHQPSREAGQRIVLICRDMEATGRSISVRHRNLWLGSYRRLGQYTEAVAVFQTWWSQFLEGATDSAGPAITVSTASQLLTARHFDVTTWEHFIACHFMVYRNVEQLFTVYQTMCQVGIQPTNQLIHFMVHAVASDPAADLPVDAILGQLWDDARKFVTEPAQRPPLWVSTLIALVFHRRWEVAVSLLERAATHRDHLPPAVYHRVLKRLFHNGQAALARRLWAAVIIHPLEVPGIDLAAPVPIRALPHVYPRLTLATVNAYLDGLVKTNGGLLEAEALFHCLQGVPEPVSCPGPRSNRLSTVPDPWRRALAHLSPDRRTLTIMITGYLHHRSLPKVDEVVDLFNRRHFIWDYVALDAITRGVLGFHYRYGDPEDDPFRRSFSPHAILARVSQGVTAEFSDLHHEAVQHAVLAAYLQEVLDGARGGSTPETKGRVGGNGDGEDYLAQSARRTETASLRQLMRRLRVERPTFTRLDQTLPRNPVELTLTLQILFAHGQARQAYVLFRRYADAQSPLLHSTPALANLVLSGLTRHNLHSEARHLLRRHIFFTTHPRVRQEGLLVILHDYARRDDVDGALKTFDQLCRLDPIAQPLIATFFRREEQDDYTPFRACTEPFADPPRFDGFSLVSKEETYGDALTGGHPVPLAAYLRLLALLFRTRRVSQARALFTLLTHAIRRYDLLEYEYYVAAPPLSPSSTASQTSASLPPWYPMSTLLRDQVEPPLNAAFTRRIVEDGDGQGSNVAAGTSTHFDGYRPPHWCSDLAYVLLRGWTRWHQAECAAQTLAEMQRYHITGKPDSALARLIDQAKELAT